MNEGEKKAIQYLNKYCDTDLFYEQQHYNYIKMVIKLVGKQQKELEQEKEKNKKLIAKIGITDWAEKTWSDILDEKYVSKDKIKEKIEELENKIHIVVPNEYNRMQQINEFKNEGALDILKELLEEK